MALCNGVVEAVSSKDVEIKRGPKAGSTSKIYSFKVGDSWYKTGFKSMVSKGDEVSFEYTDGAYGKDVKVASLSKAGSSTPTTSVSPPSVSGSGFPMGLRDKGRAINRQNALTNAVAYVTVMGGGDKDVTPDLVIEIARKFEAYTTGDLEREAAEKLAEFEEV